MAEEEKASSRADTESLIWVSPQFAELLAAALKDRRGRRPEPEVEGHAMSVEEFSSEGTIPLDTCGLIYHAAN